MASSTLQFIIDLRDKASKGFKTAQGAVKGFGNAAESVADRVLTLQNALVGLGAGAAIGAALNDASTAMAQLNVKTDETGATITKLGDVAQAVWADGYSDSITTATDVVSEAHKKMGDVSEAELERMSKKAAGLGEVFGADLKKSLSGAESLVNNFGLSWDEAFDVITSGFQRGLDSSGDFLDTINEYSTQFSNAGADVGEFFSLLESGLQGGVLGTDKAADAFKEFRVRIQDGSDTTAAALAQIGVNSTEMSQKLSDGTMTAADAFQIVIDRLRETDDSAVRMQAGVGLLGTQFEDLGDSAVLALDMTKTKMDDLAGASDDIDKAFSTLGKSIQSLYRTFMAGILDSDSGFTDGLVAEIERAKSAIQSLRDDGTLAQWGKLIFDTISQGIQYFKAFASTVATMAAPFAPLIQQLIALSPLIVTVGAAMIGLSKGLSLVTGGFAALNMAATATGLSTWLKHVQLSTQHTNLLKVATASLGNALTVIGSVGAAAFVGWNIGKVINEMKLLGSETKTVGDKVQEMYAQMGRTGASNEAIQTAGEIIARFEKFKDFKLPENIAGSTVAELDQINTSLKKAEVYWQGYKNQQEMIRDLAVMRGEAERAKGAEAEIRKAEAALKDITAQQKEFDAAIEAGGDVEQKRLEAIQKRIEAVKEGLQKEIEAEKEKAAQSIQVLEEQLANEEISISDAEAKKAEIVSQNQEKINELRLQSAQKISEIGQQEIEAIRANADAELEIVRQKKEARIITAQEAAAEEKRIIEESNAAILEASKQHMSAMENEKKAIVEESTKAYLASMEERKKAQSQVLETQLSEIKAAEAEGVLTVKQAAEEKAAVEETFYAQRLEKAQAMLQQVLEVYGLESEQFKQASQEKLEAEKQYNQQRVENARAVLEAQKQVEEERAAAIAASQEKIRGILEAETDVRAAALDKQIANIEAAEQKGVISAEQAAEQKKQAEIGFLEFKVSQTESAIQSVIAQYGKDTEEYKKAIAEKISAEAELTSARTAAAQEATAAHGAETEKQKTKTKELAGYSRKILSKPIEINVDTDPAKAAMEQLQKDFMQKAATMYAKSAKAAVSEYSAGYKWLQQQAVEQSKAMGDKFMQQAKDVGKFFKSHFRDYEAKASVDFVGRGSSETPLSEKIMEMSGKMDAFKNEASAPTSALIEFQAAGLEDVKTGLSDVRTTAEKIGQDGLSLDTSGAEQSLDRVEKKLDDIKKKAKQDLEFQSSDTKHDGGPVHASIGAFIRRAHGRLPGVDDGRDRVPVLARAGEWFIRNEAAEHWNKQYGPGFMAAINAPWSAIGQKIHDALSGGLARFAGGPVANPPRLSFATGGAVPSMTNFGTTEIRIGAASYPVMGDREIVSSLQQQLRRHRLVRGD